MRPLPRAPQPNLPLPRCRRPHRQPHRHRGARSPPRCPPPLFRLTRLLLPLYLPSGKPAQQVAHCEAFVALALAATPAAKALLSHAPKFATSAAASRLLRVHLGAILSDAPATDLLDDATAAASHPPRSPPLPLGELVAALEAFAVHVEAVAPTLAARAERAAAPPPKRKGGKRASAAAA